MAVMILKGCRNISRNGALTEGIEKEIRMRDIAEAATTMRVFFLTLNTSHGEARNILTVCFGFDRDGDFLEVLYFIKHLAGAVGYCCQGILCNMNR